MCYFRRSWLRHYATRSNVSCSIIDRVTGFWLRHYDTRSNVSFSIIDRVTGFFNLLNPSSRTKALVPNRPRTAMCNRNIIVGKEWPARKDNTLNSIYEPIL
jgi:hypothetical protein